MTYSTTVPNANQSPGLFPAQSNTNFDRLKDIINADHNFLDTTALNEGVHRQVTTIDRVAPVALIAGTNGILFSETVGGLSTLKYYNGSATYEIAPNIIKIVGSISLATTLTNTIYADPGFLWSGTGWAMISASNSFRYYSLLRSGTPNINISLSSNAGAVTRPTLLFSGNDLQIKNNDGATQTVVWSLILTRIN